MKKTMTRTLIFLLAALVAGCAAERLHRDGMVAIDQGNYEEGIAALRQAVKDDPGNLNFRLDLRARQEGVVQQLVAAGDAARSKGQSELADASYRRALAIEPGNERARRGLEGVESDHRHAERIASAEQMLARKELDAADIAVRGVLAEDPGFEPATALAAKIDLARGPINASPKLKTNDNRPVTLQFRDAPTKMVFEVLARQTGINFIFDKEVKSDGKTTIFVSQVPVEQAIDLILGQNQLSRQVLSANMVLVYPNTPAKQKDYQDEIVRTFYLANAAPKDAESMIKTVLATKTLFIDERASVLVMRDTPEHVRMAEKLIASLDVPEGEVMLEVEVLEITRSAMDTLGITYPGSVSLGMTSATGGSSLLLKDLHKQNSGTITVSPLGVSVNALKTTGLTNTLASPRIRAKNKEKAKILIGDRVPVITSGTTATTGGSYSTSNVQYLDVGLTLDVQPTIHLDGNVGIKMALEVSTIVKEVDVASASGTTVAYQIGTRNATTTLELRDGETQVLAGLIQDSDQRNSTHIPGLGDLPMLGRLFGTKTNTADKTEIVLSITPRIIRAQPRPSSEATEFWYGTESQTRSAPLGSSIGGGSMGAGGVSGGAMGGTASAAALGAPRALPVHIEAAAVTPPPALSTPIASSVAGAVPAAEAPAKAPGGDGSPTLSIDGPSTAKIGEDITVSVRLSSEQALGHVRAQVRFDASALQLVSTTPGDLASGSSEPKIDVRPGGLLLEIAGSSDAPIAGGGSIVIMHFRPVLERAATVIATQVTLVGEDGVAVAATAPTPLKLAITP